MTPFAQGHNEGTVAARQLPRRRPTVLEVETANPHASGSDAASAWFDGWFDGWFEARNLAVAGAVR